MGFGCIGQGVLPLILNHIAIPREHITILAADDSGRTIADTHGIAFQQANLTPDNYIKILTPYAGKGDFILNLTVDVNSVDLMRLALERGALYLDTATEPWPGNCSDPDIPMAERGNYAAREAVLKLQKTYGAGTPTAVSCHGANPGLISHFLKKALRDIARDTAHNAPAPQTQDEWAKLARDLDVCVVHIAERDTQVAKTPKKPGEFVNTWSIEGFYSEGIQPVELGWGSHEKDMPHDAGRFKNGCGAAIYLKRGGANTRVRSWSPQHGPYHGFLITHTEAIAMADYFTIHRDGQMLYRPTVHYAYHPCNDALLSLHELAGKNWQLQKRHRILMDEITDGIDELGVLVCGHERNAYWLGSRLSAAQARERAPYNNATSLQVAAGVLSGMIWAMENPQSGVVEPEDMDYQRVLEIAKPYIDPIEGIYSDWTPLHERAQLFPRELDTEDPWQFSNVRVM